MFWQTGTARLLPRLIDSRGTGPLFLADCQPAPARTPATADICPVTGRGRLSYQPLPLSAVLGLPPFKAYDAERSETP